MSIFTKNEKKLIEVAKKYDWTSLQINAVWLALRVKPDYNTQELIEDDFLAVLEWVGIQNHRGFMEFYDGFLGDS